MTTTGVRILVTGSRFAKLDVHSGVIERELMFAQVMALRLWDLAGNTYGGFTLVHGDQDGADRIAASIARRWQWQIEPHAADWRKYGKSAGPRRNQAMVELGAVLAVGFPVASSRGTWDCLQRAVRAGIHAYAVPLSED